MDTSRANCTIDYIFVGDSGEYWRESANTVNIIVTDGPVILESHVLPVMEGDNVSVLPALPVTEGETVTLRCRNQRNPFYLQADFYKDGNHINSSSTGELIIHSVSKSDEGLYKCISGAGESLEKQLLVKVQIQNLHGSVRKCEDSNTPYKNRTADNLHRETCLCSDHFFYILLIVRTASTMVMVALLLLLVGLLHCGKLGGTQR
ncbi:high affinity immunoglobulin gamma Fc receptor I-like [Anabas testudineus]|uniref:high affinity immunoglobulin gamma Fc receptor I-like n=1 Tax=Anabas testudineus TaxID=64144 RepID=UPI00143DF70C|nr:high affinity immunoglobulin gamma Fc receptor I-like [Anabas testudineus]